MKNKMKKSKKIIAIIVILTLICVLGVCLVIWVFAPRAKSFKEYHISLEEGRTVSHNGITLQLPTDLVEDEPFYDTIVYRRPSSNNAGAESGVLIMAPLPASEVASVEELCRDSSKTSGYDVYTYERENICGHLEIFENKNGFLCYAYLFAPEDLSTCYCVAIQSNSMEQISGILNSIEID